MAALLALPARGRRRAPGALQRPARAALAQRAAAHGAGRGGAAALAGQPGGVPHPRCLDEHGTVGDGVAQQPQRLRRQPGAGAGVPALGQRVGAGDVDRDPGADGLAGSGDLLGPAGAQEVLRLHAARVAGQHRRAALGLGTQQQHLAGVGVGRAGLVVQVVAVVPDRHQPQVVDRRERRGTGAHDDADRSAADGQEGAVALGRTRVGRQDHVAARPQPRGQRGVEAGEVAAVGHAHQRAAARGRRGHRGVGEQRRRVVAWQHRPHRPGVGSPGQRRDDVRPPGVRRPGLRVRGVRHRGRVRRRLLLDRGVAGGDGEPEHVGAGAGVAGGHVTGQRRDAGQQHRLGADHAAQRLQPAGVGGGGGPLEHEAVDVLPGEADLDPHPRLRGLGQRRGDGVVEGAVEVGERHVDEHARHRVDLGDGVGGALAGRRGAAHDRAGPGRRGQQRELLLVRIGSGRGRGLGHGCMLAAVTDSHGTRLRRRRPSSAPRLGRCAPR